MTYPRTKKVVSLTEGDQITVNGGDDLVTVTDVQPAGLDLLGGASMARVSFTSHPDEIAPMHAEVQVHGWVDLNPRCSYCGNLGAVFEQCCEPTMTPLDEEPAETLRGFLCR